MRKDSEKPRLGVKVRALRRRLGLTQAQLAERLGISSSYLNLIENDKRPLTAALLIELTKQFDIDVGSFAADTEARLVADLMEVFGDPLFDDEGLTSSDVRELVAAAPSVGRAVLKLYRSFASARESLQVLSSRIADHDDAHVEVGARPMLPSEEVSDYLQREGNHFPALEEAAEALWEEASLHQENLFAGLSRYLEEKHHVRVEVDRGRRVPLREYDPDTRRLTLSELLPPHSRSFQLAHQIALLARADLLDEMAEDASFTAAQSKALCRVTLANYFAGAVLMPYERFLDAAEAERYDVELLGHRFHASFEQVCHRLTTLARPGREGVPFHFIRVDVAGNISKKYSGSGIRFARYSGACPRWNVFAAFSTPGMIRTQVSTMPDGTRYFCIARTVQSTGGGYASPAALYAVGIGCTLEHARKLVYADGMDLDHLDAAVLVGVSCHLCERTDCAQRAFPPLSSPLRIDENRRGLTFYAPASS